MRRVIWGSSLSRWRSASTDSSIFHAMLLHHAFKGNGLAAACANVFQRGLGQIKVFKIFDVGKHSFAGIVGFGSPSELCQPVKTLLDLLRKPDCKHGYSPLYMYSITRAPRLALLLQRIRHQRDVLLARSLLLVVSLHPVFPVLARSAVFTRKFQPRDFGIADLALLRRLGRKVLHIRISQPRPRLPVEDVSLNALPIFERERNIPAIIEGLLQRLAQLIVTGNPWNPALKLFMFKPRSQFQFLHLLPGILLQFGACHALVSSSVCWVSSIFTSVAGPCGAGSLSSFRAPSSL